MGIGDIPELLVEVTAVEAPPLPVVRGLWKLPDRGEGADGFEKLRPGLIPAFICQYVMHGLRMKGARLAGVSATGGCLKVLGKGQLPGSRFVARPHVRGDDDRGGERQKGEKRDGKEEIHAP